MCASTSWRYCTRASAIRNIVPVPCCGKWSMPDILEGSLGRDSISTESGSRIGPVLTVEVGSYRYDSLSELYDTKFFGPRFLLEVRIEAACSIGHRSARIGNSVHG